MPDSDTDATSMWRMHPWVTATEAEEEVEEVRGEEEEAEGASCRPGVELRKVRVARASPRAVFCLSPTWQVAGFTAGYSAATPSSQVQQVEQTQ